MPANTFTCLTTQPITLYAGCISGNLRRLRLLILEKVLVRLWWLLTEEVVDLANNTVWVVEFWCSWSANIGRLFRHVALSKWLIGYVIAWCAWLNLGRSFLFAGGPRRFCRDTVFNFVAVALRFNAITPVYTEPSRPEQSIQRPQMPRILRSSCLYNPKSILL